MDRLDVVDPIDQETTGTVTANRNDEEGHNLEQILSDVGTLVWNIFAPLSKNNTGDTDVEGIDLGFDQKNAPFDDSFKVQVGAQADTSPLPSIHSAATEAEKTGESFLSNFRTMFWSASSRTGGNAPQSIPSAASDMESRKGNDATSTSSMRAGSEYYGDSNDLDAEVGFYSCKEIPTWVDDVTTA